MISDEERGSWPAGVRDPWGPPTAEDPRGGDGYGPYVHAVRELHDALAGAVLEPSEMADVTRRLAGITAELELRAAPERVRHDGMRPDLPGRGHLLLPPYLLDADRPGHVAGRIRFGRVHLGGNGAVHGGTQALLFDDLLGRVANRDLGGVARTAYLHIDYRQVTPVGVELRFEASLSRVEGRKRWATGRLLDGAGTVLVEAEGLFVVLLAHHL